MLSHLRRYSATIFGTPGVYGEAFHAFGNFTKPASINNGPLSNNQLYSLDLQVSDQGVARYTITHVTSNTVMKADKMREKSDRRLPVATVGRNGPRSRDFAQSSGFLRRA
jgi:hypothetical protein